MRSIAITDYSLRHQRTMECIQGHLFNVDEPTLHKFFHNIKPLVQDPSKLACLFNGFPTPQLIMEGLLPSPPRPGKMKKATAVSLPHQPHWVMLLQLDTNATLPEACDSRSSHQSHHDKKRSASLSPAPLACQWGRAENLETRIQAVSTYTPGLSCNKWIQLP